MKGWAYYFFYFTGRWIESKYFKWWWKLVIIGVCILAGYKVVDTWKCLKEKKNEAKKPSNKSS